MNSENTLMRNMASTAQCLRKVRQAKQRFLTLWLLDHRTEEMKQKSLKIARKEAQPQGHDWSMLYRGNILDD